MGARGDLRHDAAIGGVRGDLAHHLVGENIAAALRAQAHDRRRGLVASRFDSKHAHLVSQLRVVARWTMLDLI